MSGLMSDNYDTSKAIDRLVWQAEGVIGPAGWRMVGPEVEDFLRCEVSAALLGAFSRAEALYINDAIKTSHGLTVSILESVLAGGEDDCE